MTHTTDHERGAISIFIVLLILLTVTSAALILSSLLSRQLRTSLDVVATERAFYAANSGMEEGFARLSNSGEDEVIELEGVIRYEDGEAAYAGQAQLTSDTSGLQRSACITSQGEFRGRERRISIAPAGADCEF